MRKSINLNCIFIALGFLVIFSPIAHAQQNFVNIFFMRSSIFGRQFYNAIVTYGGNIAYAVEPGRTTVTFIIPGHGQQTIDLINTNVVGRVGAAWNGIVGQRLPMAPMAQGQQDNLRVRTGNVAQWLGPAGRAMTFPANVATNAWRQPVVPGRGIINISPTIVLNGNDLQTLINVFGNLPIQVLLERYLYAILMHEFGHALGLTHPNLVGVPGTPITPMNLTFADNNPLMEGDAIVFLQALRLTLRRPVRENDILPSLGETNTLLDLLNSCFPSPESKKSDGNTCYTDVKPSGLIFHIYPAWLPMYAPLMK